MRNLASSTRHSQATDRRRFRIAITLCALGCMEPALAVVNCGVSATSVAFGLYNPLTPTALDSTGMITLTCTLTPPPNRQRVPYTIGLSAGASSAYAGRYMQSGAVQLDYNLYSDSARTQVWGDGASGTFDVSGELILGPGPANHTRSTTLTVYGRVPAAQDVAPGSYSDTIVVTVVF